MSAAITPDGLVLRLRGLKLPAFVSHHGEIAARAEREGWGFVRFLGELVEIEHGEREVRRIDRLRKGSGLDPDKTLATLESHKKRAREQRGGKGM